MQPICYLRPLLWYTCKADIGQPSEDVFYKFTLPVSCTAIISTCGSAFDTYLHVLISCCIVPKNIKNLQKLKK